MQLGVLGDHHIGALRCPHSGHTGLDSAVFQGDIAALSKDESEPCKGSGVAAEVDGQSRLDGDHIGNIDVLLQNDGVAGLGRGNSLSQSLILRVADLGGAGILLHDPLAVHLLKAAGRGIHIVGNIACEGARNDGDRGLIILVDLQFAVDGAVFDLQGILILRTAVAGDLHGAIDNGLTGDGHANIAVIAKAAVHVEGHAVLLSNNGSILDDHIAAVVGQGVSLVSGQICAVQHHVLQRQVAVVLDQHLSLGAGDLAVFESNGGILQQLEPLGLRALGADQLAGNIKGKALEVHGKTAAGGNNNAVAISIFQQLDGFALFYVLKCFL